MNKEITPKNDLPPAVQELIQHAGEGLEEVTIEDAKIPRLTILQKMSPQVDEDSPEYDPQAKPGLIYDTALREAWEQVEVVPVHYEKRWVEWAPRDSGQGIVAVYERPDAVPTGRDSENRLINAETGNRIVETATFYVLNLSAEGRKSFIAMTSTQLKRARQWITYAMAERIAGPDGRYYPAPLYYRTYMLSSVPEQNPKGKFYSWRIERGQPIHEREDFHALMAEIESFRNALKSRRMVAEPVDDVM